MYDVLRPIHITVGAVALISGACAMFLKKGSAKHRLAGKCYFYSMGVVAATAIVMSIEHQIPFLLMIAVFSFSAATTGYRAIYQKRVRVSTDVAMLDWIVEIVKSLFGLGLLGYAVLMFSVDNSFLGILSGVFGTISLLGGLRTMQHYRKPPEQKMRWFFEHMGNMSGAYIATMTAFLVNNIHGVPPLLVWLGPTAIGVPLIFYWINTYKRRIAVRKAARYEEIV